MRSLNKETLVACGHQGNKVCSRKAISHRGLALISRANLPTPTTPPTPPTLPHTPLHPTSPYYTPPTPTHFEVMTRNDPGVGGAEVISG